jgi:hypothetical protein
MRSSLGRCALLVFGMAGFAAAQAVPFQILLTSGTTSATVANDSSVGFNAEIGKSTTIQATATYTGNGQVTVSSPPQLLGSSEFLPVSLMGTLPITLMPGNSLSFSMTFSPSVANQASAQLTIPFAETLVTGATTTTTTQSAIILILQGTSPSYVLSYILTASGNVVPLQSGGAIPFPATQINTSVIADLNISNGGSGPGTITAITQPTDPAFKVAGIPLITTAIPYTLASAATLQLQITYTPTAVGTDSDQIQITLGSGTVLTVMLQGSGINAVYTYQLIQNGTSTPVTPPGPIALPNTNVGSTSSITVQVMNTGNATGIITAPPSTSGAAFSLTDNTVFPQTLKAGGLFTFTINFAPTQPGAQTGTLIVGTDLFNLTGNGQGSNLTFSYTSKAGTTTLPTVNPTVIFSPVAVSQSEQLTFTVMNAGTTPTTLSNIGIVQNNSPFSVSGLPSLPATVAAGGSFQFTINFAPTVVGLSNGMLQLDTATVGLSGSGTPPPPLPSYTIQGPSGSVTPATQSPVSLTLAASYPVDLSGTLTITSSGMLVSDPAVQFSTSNAGSGGRAVSFVIPANTTAANFAGQGSQVFLQTGTVSSTITLTPSFTTTAGDINVTPTNPTTLQFTVPTAAPVLIAVTTAATTANSLTLQVTGYSTTRSLGTLSVQFTPAAGFNLAGAQASVDLSQVSSVWFQSTASEAFGGEFTVTETFTLQGTLPVNKTLLEAISAVSATISNSVGTSNSLADTLQ